MRADAIKIWTTSTAAWTAIAFMIPHFHFERFAVLPLSIEVILLPAIYIVGNIMAESILQREHEEIVEILESNQKETREFKRIKKNVQKLREMRPWNILVWPLYRGTMQSGNETWVSRFDIGEDLTAESNG